MIRLFFSNSSDLDWMVLRPLSHIKSNWELTWDHINLVYEIEEDSYAEQLNYLINEIEELNPPEKYHDNEDILAENVIKSLKWPISKKGNRWEGDDYQMIIEQGGFHDLNEQNLILATAGRIHSAIKRGQNHFDVMEESHKFILAAFLTIILYHRNS